MKARRRKWFAIAVRRCGRCMTSLCHNFMLRLSLHSLQSMLSFERKHLRTSIILWRINMSRSCLSERSAPWRQIFSGHFFPTGITEWANRRVGRINRLFCQYWRALAYGHVVTLTHRVNLSMLCWLWPRHWNSNSMLFYEMKARLNVWNSISRLVTFQSPATYAS